MNNKYSDYFEIDEGYFPEINESSIKDSSNKWQDTYPHESFVELLKAAERMLARGSNSDKKGLWIEGAYGTGKSRILWTLQNLMDCSNQEFCEYFDTFEALQAESDLRTKFLGHKQNKIITAYRYASSSIDGDRSLIVAVYESLTTALRRAKVSKLGATALRGKICEWLSDELNKNYFNQLLLRPEYRGIGSFAGKNADDIIKVLQNANANVENLVQDIFKLADDRGIRALSIDMNTLIAWITEVIDSNNLKAIVLFWDEFSDYFQKNKNNLGEFQKLVELSSIKPFYMVIVTHQSESIFGESSENGRKVCDRFVRKTIELPEPIAFELIRHALKVKEAQQENWITFANEMNGRMTSSREEICKVVWKAHPEKGDRIMQGLLPLHPFAALLLKHISTMFASNQRSMFNFIKTPETENLHAFQWFINTYGPEEGNVLSIDFLWNFFYEKGLDEHSSRVGRDNINDARIRTILDVYPHNESRLMEDEKRVLKTILMMQAMSLRSSLEQFLTTDKNINQAFEGTDLENRCRPSNIAKKLVKDNILYPEPMGKDKICYSAAAVSGDQSQIDEIKEEKRKKKTRELIDLNPAFDSVLSLTPALSLRYKIYTVTAEDFTKICNGLRNEPAMYQFYLVLCIARNEEEQDKMRKLLFTARGNEEYRNLVFVDAISTLFNSDRYEQWIDYSASEEYWRPKDRKLADEMARNALEILGDWQGDISNGSFTVHSHLLPSPTYGSTAKEVCNILLGIIRKKYPLSLDNVSTTEVMWRSSSLTNSAKHGIDGTSGNPVPSSILDLIKKEQPTLDKLHDLVQKRIEQAFQKEGRISIGDIFDLLMEHGFMPCNLYSYLTGHLLKDYTSDTYRWSDGDISSPMDAKKLSEIIANQIKHTNSPISRYREPFIEIMTPDQKSFVDLAAGVFRISNTLSVEDVIRQICTALKNLGFPLWCFKEIDTFGLEPFLDMFGQVVNPQDQRNTSQIVTKLGRMSKTTPTAMENLARLLTKENGKEAMNCFLEHFENGDVRRFGKETGADVLLDIRNIFDKTKTEALWLWDQEIGEDEIRKLLTNYKIVEKSNHLISRSSSLPDCLRQWREKGRSIKIPYAALVSEVPPSFKKFLPMWNDIVKTGELSHEKRETFLHELENISSEFVPFMDSIRDIFKRVYSVHLTHFNDEEIQELYSKLPVGMFENDRSYAENEVSNRAIEMQQKQEKFKLTQLWQEKTGTKSPKDWSSKNQTPIGIMIPENEESDFRRAFKAFLPSASNSDIKFALEFLQIHVDFFANLADKSKVDAAFAHRIVGKYTVLLPDVEEVRSRLADKFDEAYDWYPNPIVQTDIEKMAQARYSQNGYEKVLEHIEQMDARKVKEYLQSLIRDNMTVGIEIILETGGET